MKNINTFALGLTCTFTNAHVHVGISSERGQIGLGSNLVDLVIEILDEDVAAGRPTVDKFLSSAISSPGPTQHVLLSGLHL